MYFILEYWPCDHIATHKRTPPISFSNRLDISLYFEYYMYIFMGHIFFSGWVGWCMVADVGIDHVIILGTHKTNPHRFPARNEKTQLNINYNFSSPSCILNNSFYKMYFVCILWTHKTYPIAFLQVLSIVLSYSLLSHNLITIRSCYNVVHCSIMLLQTVQQQKKSRINHTLTPPSRTGYFAFILNILLENWLYSHTLNWHKIPHRLPIIVSICVYFEY